MTILGFCAEVHDCNQKNHRSYIGKGFDTISKLMEVILSERSKSLPTIQRIILTPRIRQEPTEIVTESGLRIKTDENGQTKIRQQ